MKLFQESWRKIAVNVKGAWFGGCAKAYNVIIKKDKQNKSSLVLYAQPRKNKKKGNMIWFGVTFHFLVFLTCYYQCF